MVECGVEESGATRSREVELYGLITSTTKFAQQRFNVVALASSYLEQEATIQEEVMKFHLLFSTHIEIRDVVGTFFVMFSRVVECTMRYTGHVLHARTDRDTVTDSDLAATPSSIDRSGLGATTLVEDQGQSTIEFADLTTSELLLGPSVLSHKTVHICRMAQGPGLCACLSDCLIPVSLLIVPIQFARGHRAVRVVRSPAQPHEHFEFGIVYC